MVPNRPGHADVAPLLTCYAGPEVRLGALLADAHDGPAVTYVGPSGTVRWSYSELSERSMRLAGTLLEAGVTAGDRVAVMLPKSPELAAALVAVWRIGAAHVPLFTAFGPDAVSYRVRHSGARAVVTDSVNREKFAGVDDTAVTFLCHQARAARRERGDIDLATAMDRGSPAMGVARDGDDLFILLYTSGTTGQPKGVEVPVRALASFHSYMRYSLDVQPADVFWNIADPGWGYGLWFAIIGPLLLGQTVLLRGLPFDAGDVFAAIADHEVTNLTGAPTVYRSLRAFGPPPGFLARCQLRCASSAGEPLNPELLDWSARELGVPVHDHYGQSELGMPIGFAHDSRLRRTPVPGSMGFPAPGYRVVILDEQGAEAPPGTHGELAIDVRRSPLYWFRGYHRDPARTHERFRHGPGYYLTGDGARADGTGLLHFTSRTDDVITSSGYRIGPFEVESALIRHPAVAEAAVIGTPDELRGEAVTAFVVPVPGTAGTPQLAEQLQLFVKSRLAAHLYPRRVVFADALPRTPSGKIRRNVLRERWQERAGEVCS
jgi:acetyl-CoA synthetase